MKEAKFEIGELLGLGFTLIVLGIAIAYGIELTIDVGENLCTSTSNTSHHFDGECYNCGNWSHNVFVEPKGVNGVFCTNGTNKTMVTELLETTTNVTPTDGGGHAFNGTQDSVTGVGKITSKAPTIATVIVASVIIGIIATYLYARFS